MSSSSAGAGADRILPCGAREPHRQRVLRRRSSRPFRRSSHWDLRRLLDSFYLMEAFTWSQGIGFALIAAGAFLIFHKF